MVAEQLYRAHSLLRAPVPPRLRVPISYPRGSMGYDAIVLASASERRSRLLAQIGVRHRVRAPASTKRRAAGESPPAYVQRLAAGKAQRSSRQLGTGPDCPVLAADTTVVLDGSSSASPQMRRIVSPCSSALAGRRHEVLTAVSLWHDGRLHEAFATSHVTFRTIDVAECRRYWASGEPAGKAGAYAIQGFGAVFVRAWRVVFPT